MIKLIAFLGNPGQEYRNTRHNIAFSLFDEININDSLSNKFHSIFAQNNGMKMIKPMTYMNLSGTAVSEAMSFYKLKRDELLVVHDDSELKVGEVKLQQGGGLKGHKGLKSIAERIGGDDFFRLRIGIGRPKYGDMRIYALSPFSKSEEPLMKNALKEAENIIKSIN